MVEGNPQKVFHHTFRVQENELDELNHVNNVVYLRWVQDVAAAHWASVATEEMKKKYLWVVLRHEIDYRNPAFLGDELVAQTWVSSCDGVRSVRNVKFYQSGNGKLVAETKTTWCLLDAQFMKPKRIEQDVVPIFM